MNSLNDIGRCAKLIYAQRRSSGSTAQKWWKRPHERPVHPVPQPKVALPVGAEINYLQQLLAKILSTAKKKEKLEGKPAKTHFSPFPVERLVSMAAKT